ncbi:2-hydroxychromene-2-carboxylate isomerase [Alcaligenaceae bacterium]|nr:2-hydroxychromene-2-carboxylate isomerase [Alcaligenaceae bacterium]
MASPIDFYFDFSSPYAYFASTQIEALATECNRTVHWRPILLGPIFKVSGSGPLTNLPMKGNYARRDFARTAQLFGIPYNQPQPFPIHTINAARATLFLQQQGDDKATPFIQRLFKAYFAEGKNISELDTVLELAGQMGIDPDKLAAGIAQENIKELLKTEVNNAIDRGVFGTPFMIIDDEPFWGFDRFDHIRKWLKRQAS